MFHSYNGNTYRIVISKFHKQDFITLPIRGRRIIAAVASISTTGALEYEAYANFQREYSDIFGLEQGLRWSDYDGLVLCLDATVHNSFVWYITLGVGRWWYMRHIQQAHIYGRTMEYRVLPMNYKAYGVLPVGVEENFQSMVGFVGAVFASVFPIYCLINV